MNVLELINLEIKLRNLFIKLLSQKDINVELETLIELAKLASENYPEYKEYLNKLEKEKYRSMYSIDKRIKMVGNAIETLESALVA